MVVPYRTSIRMVVYIKRYPHSKRRRSDLPVIRFRLESGPTHPVATHTSTSTNPRTTTMAATTNPRHRHRLGDSSTNSLQHEHEHEHEHQQNQRQNPCDTVPVVPPDDQLDDLQKLERHCPGSTKAERKRFLKAKAGDYRQALEQLQKYLEWRHEYGLDHDYHCSTLTSVASLTANANTNTNTNTYANEEHDKDDDDGIIWHGCASDDQTLDELDWKFASQKALACDESTSASIITATTTTTTTIVLPQLARIIADTGPPHEDSSINSSSSSSNTHGHGHNHSCDRDGNRILQLLPAQMDLSVASDATFALCIALYLERKLGRDSDEKMTVVIDVRGGDGWANPSPNKLVPFVKRVSACLEQNFPERLSKSVLFPMPVAATFLWRVVRVFLDPNTAEKIAVVRGSAGNDDKPPYRLMEKHVDRGVLERMEELRCASFV